MALGQVFIFTNLPYTPLYLYADHGFLMCYFLQKEIALYTASKANLEFSQFNIDDDVDPLFKVNFIFKSILL